MLKLDKELLGFIQTTFSDLEIEYEGLPIFFATCLSRFENMLDAIILLFEAGLKKESEMICRSLFELAFKVTAVKNDPDILKDVVGEYLFIQKKRLKKFIDGKLDPGEISLDELADRIQSIDNKIKTDDLTFLNKLTLAEKGNLTGFYLSSYDLLSDPTHVSSSDLDSLLIVEEKFIKHVRFGRWPSEESEVLVHCAVISLKLLREFGKVFSKDVTDWADAFEKKVADQLKSDDVRS